MTAATRLRPRVVIVDDVATMRRYASEPLAAQYDVVTASNGAEGWACIQERTPDLIVTDIEMPFMTGAELVARVRLHPELNGVPILILSGNDDNELRIQLLRAGAQDYLSKPFSVAELCARVSNLVSVKRARDVLQHELSSREADIELLAREAAARQQELQTALLSVEVARERAESASRGKSQFLGMVSHEMRTPVMAFGLQLERLSRALAADVSPKMRDIVTRLEGSARRLTEVVESVLGYAAIESGRLTVEPRPFELAALLDEVLGELAGRAEEKGLRLARAAGPPITLGTDPRLFRLIAFNLIANAIKFTSTGSIEIAATEVGAEVVLTVRDTGPGIPVSDQERVFLPFEQLESVRGKHRPGVGLGLALVKEMSHAIGGRVELHSEVGRGSTFRVVLPR